MHLSSILELQIIAWFCIFFLIHKMTECALIRKEGLKKSTYLMWAFKQTCVSVINDSK